MNPLMMLIMMFLHHAMQGGGQAGGQNSPSQPAGGPTAPPAQNPSLMGSHGAMQGPQGQKGPMQGGLPSLLNLMGMQPHQTTPQAQRPPLQ